jgi:hypothetical protein
MATSCVQRGAAWTFAAWCLRFSHGVRGSAGMPAVWECEGARGGVSVRNRRFFACTHRTGPARRRRASQSEAVRTHAAPSWTSRMRTAAARDPAATQTALTFSTSSSSGPGDACISKGAAQTKSSFWYGCTRTTGGGRRRGARALRACHVPDSGRR